MTRNPEPSDSDHTSRRQSSPGDDPSEGGYSGEGGRGYGGDGYGGDEYDEYDDRERRPSMQPHRDDRDDRDDDGDIDIDPDIMEVLDNNDLEQMDGPDA